MAKSNAKPKAAKPAEVTNVTATVISEFRDNNDFSKIFEVGDDVSDLPSDRLQSLLDLGYIELSGDLTDVDDSVDQKAQLEDVLKGAPDEVKASVLKRFDDEKPEGDEAFTTFLDAVKKQLAA